MEKKKLEIDFLDGLNKRFRLSIDDPKEELDRVQIQAAMEEILTHNVFVSNGADLADLNAARVIKTIVDEMEF